jgi:hypothetical protein
LPDRAKGIAMMEKPSSPALVKVSSLDAAIQVGGIGFCTGFIYKEPFSIW